MSTSSAVDQQLLSDPQEKAMPFDVTVARQASDWLVLFASGSASDHDWEKWRAWLNQDSEHARAWQHIENVNARMQGLPANVALSTLGSTISRSRRKSIQMFAMILTAGGAGMFAHQVLPWRVWAADYSTGTGKRQVLTLDDGTELILNTATSVDVVYDQNQRLLRLRSGEVMITTGHRTQVSGLSDARPLMVETHEGRVRALGTRFSVRQDAELSVVAVFDGAVEISPQFGSHPQIVRAGQAASFSLKQVHALTVADQRSIAWVDGLIVADSRRLADFVAELDRYRPGRLSCHPAVADLRVSGVFKLRDSDGILAALTEALPVRVDYRTRYWVSVNPL